MIYKMGTDIPIPDALSRDCQNIEEPDEEDIEINIILSTTNFILRLKNEIEKDNDLITLKSYIMNGFPDDQSVSKELKHVLTFREELACYDDLLFKGDKLIISKSLQTDLLKFTMVTWVFKATVNELERWYIGKIYIKIWLISSINVQFASQHRGQISVSL